MFFGPTRVATRYRGAVGSTFPIRTSRPRRLVCTALIALAGGCAGDSGQAPPWQRLAHASLPSKITRAAADAPGNAGGRAVRFSKDGDQVWIDTILEREHWSRAERPHTWIAEVPTKGIGRPPSGTAPQRLEGSGRSFRFAGTKDDGGAYTISPNCFLAAFGFVQVVLDEGVEPPDELRLGFFARHDVALAEARRVSGRRYSGEGFALHAGDRAELSVNVPAASKLRFATTIESAFLEPAESAGTRFRVSLDGASLFEHEMTADQDGSSVWHEVDLPASGASAAKLVFEVGRRLRLLVVSGARDRSGRHRQLWKAPGTPRRRRAPRHRPVPDRHPARRLPRGLRRDAWHHAQPRPTSAREPALPAHLVGLLLDAASPRLTLHRTAAAPDRHHRIRVDPARSVDHDRRSDDATRLSHRCGHRSRLRLAHARHGTKASSGSASIKDELEGTLGQARAFLDADDGRPTFLFVHTYKIHSPYDYSEQTGREYGELLGLDFEEDHDTLYEAWKADATDLSDDLAGKLKSLYLAGVVDMDRSFGSFHEELAQRGLLERGYLVVTSDHGEVFGEHHELYHCGTVFEEAVRIPLMLAGADLVPGANEHAASLVDLTPTLADLAGISPLDSWVGSSLLSLDRERAVFSFQCLDTRGPSSMGIVEGEHKIIGYDRPRAQRPRRAVRRLPPRTRPRRSRGSEPGRHRLAIGHAAAPRSDDRAHAAAGRRRGSGPAGSRAPARARGTGIRRPFEGTSRATRPHSNPSAQVAASERAQQVRTQDDRSPECDEEQHLVVILFRARVLNPVSEGDDAQHPEHRRLADAGLEAVEEVEQIAAEGEGKDARDEDPASSGADRAHAGEWTGIEVLDRLRAEPTQDSAVVQSERQHRRPGVPRTEESQEQEGEQVLWHCPRRHHDRSHDAAQHTPAKVLRRAVSGLEGAAASHVSRCPGRQESRQEPRQEDCDDPDRQGSKRGFEAAIREDVGGPTPKAREAPALCPPRA